MKVIVVGCGRAGAELAYRLYQKGHRVSVIDSEAQAFANLSPEFRGRTIEGEAMSREVLRSAGIKEADALAAVTNLDSLNVVVAHVARTVYHVPTVVARNYNPRWRELYEAFGLPVVSSIVWGARRLEEMLYDKEIHSVFSAGNGEVAIYEFVIPEAWQGQSLPSLLSIGHYIPVALTRAGRAMWPSNDLLLQADDIIHVSATFEDVAALRQRLNQGVKES